LTVILGDRIITIRERLWQNVQLAAGVQIGTFAVFVGMVLLAPSRSPWLIPIFSLGILTGVYLLYRVRCPVCGYPIGMQGAVNLRPNGHGRWRGGLIFAPTVA
jgi:hypothetical protein